MKTPIYNIFREFGKPKIFPINYTLSITNLCPSRCKTCFIWKLYKEKRALKNEEFSTSEWIQIIEKLGKSPFWVTISGGEPFARGDVTKLCRTICEVNKPKIINIPTNGILHDRIKNEVPKILDACTENNVSLVVNLSIDEIGERHDEIRGVKGNWHMAMKSLVTLKSMKSENQNMVVGIHTVVSNYNIARLPEIVRYINEELNPDHYVMEVAEERSELFNQKTNITPTPSELKRTLNNVMNYLERKNSKVKGLGKISLAFRIRYYELIPKILEEKRQQVPCMSSFASCQITPYGDVWACCILGYDKPLGNLKETSFNFEKIWKSKKAEDVRKFIKEKQCSCPLANAHYTNLLLNFAEAAKIALKML